MYANLSSNENEGLKALSHLLVAPPELRCVALALMNNFRSPLVLYGTEPLSKKKRTNLGTQRAIVDSGADLHL